MNPLKRLGLVIILLISFVTITYATIPIDNNFYYNLNNTGDSTGQHTNLTLGTTVQNVTGFIGTGKGFDNLANDIMTMGDSFTYGAGGNFTLIAWVNPNSTGGGDVFMASQNNTNGFVLGKFVFTADERLQFGVYKSGSLQPTLNSPGAVPTNSWTMIVLTAESITGSPNMTYNLYMNLSNVAGGVRPRINATESIFSFGKDPTSGGPLSGRMDEITAYQYVLTSTQLTDYYNCVSNGIKERKEYKDQMLNMGACVECGDVIVKCNNGSLEVVHNDNKQIKTICGETFTFPKNKEGMDYSSELGLNMEVQK